MEPYHNQNQPETQNNLTPNKNKHFGRTLAIGGGVLVLLVGFFFLGLYGVEIMDYFKNREKNASTEAQNKTNAVVKDRSDFFLGEMNNLDSNINTATTTNPSQNQNPNEVWLDVEWNKDVVKITCPKYTTQFQYSNCFDTGKVLSGEYKGMQLMMEEVKELGTSYNYHILKGDKAIILWTFPNTPDNKVYRFKGVDDVPEMISLPNTSYKFKKAYASQMFSSVLVKVKLFDDKVLGSVYLAENGCVIVKLPNHTALAYNLVIPFVNEQNGSVDATFNSGAKNTDNYIYNKIMGCGSMCYYLAVQDENVLKPQERLMVAGILNNGENIYEFSDTNAKELKELYNDKNTLAYMNDGYINLGKNKYSYQEFLDLHPLLFWKDPLGRWVQFKNNKFDVAAEMCKPVIYLYPEKETNLSVRVFPNGGFTYTNPPYGEAWEVVATPEGKITDSSTGQKFDYLFWEGVGLNYPISETGWVIEKQNLEKFFNEILPKLGLKGRETADFKEYWLSRLSEHPYYRLSFLSEEQFNEIAPLKISGAKPNTVIRILMTAKGLDVAETSVPQKLTPIKLRQGFTVIEWGGVVLK